MVRTVKMVPIDVSSESQRRVGIAVWRYQPDHTQNDWDGVTTFMAMNGFPTRIPQDQIGRFVFLLNQAGFQVEFQPMPSRKLPF